MKTAISLARLRPRPRLLAGLLGMIRLQKTRRALAGIDPHLLRDIGLTPEEAAREAARPPWDPPVGWRNPD